MGKNNSWVKVEGVENLIARKIVDYSLITGGIHIPKEYYEKFLSVAPNENLQLGKSIEVVLVFDDIEFRARLTNKNVRDRNDTIQLLYKKDVVSYLKNKLKVSYNYIISHKIKGSKKSVDIPTDIEEYMEFYKTDKPNTYKVKLITKNISANEEENSKINVTENSIKQKFFNYIGEKGTLGNKYQKSYKLVLLMSLLHTADKDGKGDYDKVCSRIIDIYNERSSKGFPVETKDSDIQSNSFSLTINIIKKVMNENAYKVISSKGYILKKDFDGIEHLCFDVELWKELSEEDKECLKEILRDKLQLYYRERVDKDNNEYDEEIDGDIIGDDEEMIEEEILENPDDTLAVVNYIHNYIRAKGFEYDKSVIKNFYLSLKTKPFVILSGISGTGKSKIVELFAEAIGANSGNGRFHLIPVRPDWSDGSELIGYRNIESKFQPGILTNIAKEAAAAENADKPYFLCLDEMNLARVEYYFSDLLSIMESRKINNDDNITKTEKLIKNELFGADEEAREVYGDVYIPQNLYIIGTVNMDETTFPFSRKVLDRANTIEFNDVNLGFDFEKYIEERNKREQENESTYNKAVNYHNDLLRSKYIKLVDCIENNAEEHSKIGENVIDELTAVNKILEKVNLHFGYRVRDEIVFYVLYAVDENIMTFEKALDYAIKQKILSRIQGSSSDIQQMLVELFTHFTDYKEKDIDSDYIDEDVLNKLEKHIKDNEHKDENKIKYPFSAKKTLKMIRRFLRDGFTTFWE